MGEGKKPKMVEMPESPEPNDPRAEEERQKELARIRRMKGRQSTKVSGEYGGTPPSLKKTLGG